MDFSHPPENDGKKKSNAVFRRMGMSLSVFGAVVFAAGLVVCSQKSGEASATRSVLMLVSGIAMFVSGLYIWRIAKPTDRPQ